MGMVDRYNYIDWHKSSRILGVEYDDNISVEDIVGKQLNGIEKLYLIGKQAVENVFDWKEKVASTSDQETKMLDTPMPPFDGNVEDPKYLKNSELPKINIEMMCHNQLSSMFCFQNLKDLIISNCCNLKFLFSSSTLTSFVQLQCLKIRNCKAMEEIIRIDDLGNNIELLYLKKLSIEECPEMKAIIFGDKPTCGVGESSMDANDWRNQLTHNTRR